MIRLLLLTWYMYDDALASSLNAPEIGSIPIVVWLIMFVISIFFEL